MLPCDAMDLLLTDLHAATLAGADYGAIEDAAKDDPRMEARMEAYLERPAEELYDVESDPTGLRNLVGDPEHDATLEYVRALVQARMDYLDDPFLYRLPDATDEQRERVERAYELYESRQEIRLENLRFRQMRDEAARRRAADAATDGRQRDHPDAAGGVQAHLGVRGAHGSGVAVDLPTRGVGGDHPAARVAFDALLVGRRVQPPHGLRAPHEPATAHPSRRSRGSLQYLVVETRHSSVRVSLVVSWSLGNRSRQKFSS